MPALNYPDEETIKAELRNLVHREMASTFDELDRVQAELEAVAATLDETKKDEVAEKIEKINDGKLEMITLFKAMYDFLGGRPSQL